MNLARKLAVGAGLMGALALNSCATTITKKGLEEGLRQLTEEEITCIADASCALSKETIDKLKKIYEGKYEQNTPYQSFNYKQ